MKKILNTFKYGSAQVKRVLVLTMLAGAGTVGLVVAALVLQQMLLFFGAVICAFITISLIQSFEINRQDDGQEMSGQEKQEEKTADKTQEKTDKLSKHKTEKQKKKKHKAEKHKAEKQKKEKPAEKRTEKKKEKEDEKGVPGNEMTEQDEIREPEEKVPEPVSDEELESYDRHKIRKTLRKYKVKRDHRMAIVDNCKALSIYQTPAYIWVDDKEFHMLLIEKEPRHITFPLYKLRNITYLKKQEANEDIDYAAFKSKSILTEVFRPYLPDYAHSTVMDDLSAYKNLYGIGPDIYFTNRSAANLFELLGAEFTVDDKVTMSTKVNFFFKDAYKANILLRDNVIDANGYADKISGILDSMAHSSLSYAEFKDTLNLMIKNKLITQEFAMYYMGVRDKISR